MATKIQIQSIVCNSPSEEGNDEVYLVCQADAGVPVRYPAEVANYQSLGSGDTWTLSDPKLILHFEYEVLVTLWDQDVAYDPQVATFLQCHDFRPGDGGTSVNLTNPNGANYTINYSFLD